VLETGLFQLLTVTDAITHLCANRVFFVKMPGKETVLPSVVFQVITARSVSSAQGFSHFRFVHVQFDSYATNYTDAVTLSNALRARLASFSGPLPDGTIIHGSIVLNEMDQPYEAGTGGYIFRRILEIEFQQIDD
jgi:Protein of unknown function (DUF3168)